MVSNGMLHIFAMNWDSVFKRFKLYRITFTSEGTKTHKLMGQSKNEKHLLTYIPKEYIAKLPRGVILTDSSYKKLWFPSEELAEKVLNG